MIPAYPGSGNRRSKYGSQSADTFIVRAYIFLNSGSRGKPAFLGVHPHNVKYWCLGNEMDGPWQIGHMTAREYGLKARDCANQMRMVDPSLQLIACGSSGPGMSTYPEWDCQVIEEVYNLEDALLVGRFCNSLMRRADRVRIACLAQLVSVIAPIMTNENGFFRQTTCYPYVWAIQYARGGVLDFAAESPTYEVKGKGQIPYLDVSATMDGKTYSLFILNRDLVKPHNMEIVWREAPPERVLFSQVMTGGDLKACNSFEEPKKVAPNLSNRQKSKRLLQSRFPPAPIPLLNFIENGSVSYPAFSVIGFFISFWMKLHGKEAGEIFRQESSR